ncbi:MAG: hypothetical protein CFE22_11280 [Cytophagaceae bacterium BCCC1]|nr:MAG: hypothetical protein CFE22_11280 [Cytophagaceae bacterium BCCC1]
MNLTPRIHLKKLNRHSISFSKSLFLASLKVYLCRTKIQILFLFFSIGVLGSATAQQYPVDCRISITPPYANRFYDYQNSPQRFKVTLLLQDHTKPTLDVVLQIRLKGPGFIIENPGDFFTAQPITLNPGRPQTLSGLELSDNFSPANLETQGIELADLFTGGGLPPGPYEWEVRAFELYRDRQVSNTASFRMNLALNYPPLLNQPTNKAQLSPTQPQSINFTWMPRPTASLAASQGLLYTLMLYEVPLGEDPNAVVNSGSAPFRVIETGQTNYFYGPLEVPLEVGKTYAWQVKVSDINGQETYVNNGYSEVSWFRYGKACTATEDLKATEIGPNRVNLSWKADPQAMGYKVYYKNQTAADWQTQTTFGTSLTLAGLDQKEPYSFKISTLCDVDRESPTRPEITWEVEEVDTELQKLIDAVLHPLDQISSTSNSRDNSNNTVGNTNSTGFPSSQAATEPLPTNIANLIPTDPTKITCVSQVRGFENCSVTHDGVTLMGTEPLQSLAVGDPLTIYDMQAIVTEVSGGGGTYSGKALVKLPFLADMMMAVEFSNIEVKTEKPATYRGGCVTNVPASGFFRARTGLSREELKAEEVAFLNTIRNQIQPGNDLQTFATIISNQEGITKTINDSKGDPISPELVEKYVTETTQLIASLNNWKDKISQLDKTLNGSDLTFVGLLIESLGEELAQGVSDLQTDPKNAKLPTETGSKINSILDILKGILDNPNDQKPPVVVDASTTLKDKKSAILSWTGDKRFTHYMVSYQTEGQGEVLLKTENTRLALLAMKENSIYNIKVTGVMQAYTSNAFTKLQTKGPDLPKIQITHSDLEATGKYKVEWAADPIYIKYLFKYTDTKGFVRYVNPSKNSVLFSEFDYNQDYTYTLVGITKDGSRSDEIPGNFLVNANCPFLSEIVLESNPEKIVSGDQLNLSVKPSANLACLSQIEWYNKFEQLIGTGRNISVEMNYSNATITAKCKSMLGQSGTILTDCSISRQFDIIEAQCEVTNVTASETNVFEGEEIMLSISNGCFRGSESYWLKDGEIIGQGDKIYVKPALNSTSAYYAVCQDGDFSCVSPAPSITVRPLCEKMELTFPRFTDEYLLVQAVNCPNVAQWTWTNANVKKAAWTKKDGFQKGYLEQFSEQNAILLKLNDANDFSITARCEQTPCTATKTFNDNSACSNENCTTIPVVTYLGDDFYEVRLVQSLDNEKEFRDYIVAEKIIDRSFWDWLSPKIADNYQDKLEENRKEAACDYQIPAFNWLELNSTKPNQIIQAKDLPQVYHIQKKLTVQNGFEPLGSSTTPIPRFDLTENCTQQLEILIPKKGSATSENVNFELKTISLPNGEEYIFPTGCQNQWEEGLVVIDLPAVPGNDKRQLKLLNSQVTPIQVQEKPWQVRFTCYMSGSVTPITYKSDASTGQIAETAAIWTATAILLAYGIQNPPQTGIGLPIPNWEANIPVPVASLYNFFRENFNSTFIPYNLLNPQSADQVVNIEQYQTTNVVKRVVNELCKELSGGTYTKAQKKEILCQLQKNIKAASPTIKDATDAEIEAFANGDCSKIIKLWTNAVPIAKATAEGILAKNKDLLTQGGQGDCSPSNETLIVTAEIVQQPTCDGQKGEVRLTANGGNGSYQYKLSTSPSWQRETRFTNLEPGTYVFEARDSDGNKGATTVKLEIKLENGQEEVEASSYYEPPVTISSARIGSEPSITVQWDALNKVYTFTPKTGVTITKLSKGRIKLSTTNPEDQKWEGEYRIYFKKNDHNTFIGFYGLDMSGPCTSSKYTEECKPLCQERWLPEEIYNNQFVICNEWGILELGSISYKIGTKVYLRNNERLEEIGKIGETINLELILNNIFGRNKEIAKKSTLWEWIWLVKPGGDWDYKDEIQLERNNIFGLGNKLREEKGVYTKYQWKEHLFLDASDIGNFNFGYTGRFIGNVGFKRQTLNEYAGYLQTGKDILSIDNFLKGIEEFRQIHNTPPFGDEQDDFEWSNKGMDFAEIDSECACPID